MNIRLIPFLISTVTGLIVFLGSFYAYNAEIQEFRSQERAYASDHLASIASTLSQTINVRLNHTRSLAAFVRANRDFTPAEFDEFATTLQKDLVGLRSLQLAPNGVVTYLTNLDENRRALGHDLFADPKRRHLVEKSVRERKYIIAGPIDLIQGGRAIIARRPLFFPRRHDGVDEFWGFATVLIDVEPLLTDAGFFEMGKDMDLAVRGTDGLGAKGGLFYGVLDTFGRAAATAEVILPSGTWQIAAAFKPNYQPQRLAFLKWILVLGAVLGAIVCAAVYVIVERPVRLRKAITTATSDLRLAKEEAETANRAKSEFLSTMSHELRTPLTAIEGGLGLALGGALGEISSKLEEMLEIALRNSSRLGLLIDDILDLAKIESGNMKFDMSAVDTAQLVEKCIAVNQPFADQYGISYVAGTMVHAVVYGDEPRLMQVLSNLMSNAAKFSPKGSTVEVATSRTEGGVRISVSDRGCGISEEFRNEIFGRFSQADSSDNRQIGGTGLGLNISRFIVEHHGGIIDFVSQAGTGSTFFFDLPQKAGRRIERRRRLEERRSMPARVLDGDVGGATELV